MKLLSILLFLFLLASCKTIKQPKTSMIPGSKKILDIKSMPGYEHRVGFTKDESVSKGRVFLKAFPAGIYPSCINHGAILLVDVRDDGGKVWRCRELGCDEGCFMPK